MWPLVNVEVNKQKFKPWLLSIHHVGSIQPMGELSNAYPWEGILSLVPQ
jgi:hypothetical protein